MGFSNRTNKVKDHWELESVKTQSISPSIRPSVSPIVLGTSVNFVCRQNEIAIVPDFNECPLDVKTTFLTISTCAEGRGWGYGEVGGLIASTTFQTLPHALERDI